ncbi:MAG: hypothetical protein KDA69_17000, partial [Planctomycetaceae bacterium]|nr:hypothetical protein [Planctomycetaceae bacterium]
MAPVFFFLSLTGGRFHRLPRKVYVYDLMKHSGIAGNGPLMSTDSPPTAPEHHYQHDPERTELEKLLHSG